MALHSSEVFVSRVFEVSSHRAVPAFRAARVTLMAVLVLAPWAFGAVDAWAWMLLGLGACAALIMWAVTVAKMKWTRIVWSPLFIPLASFFLLALVGYFSGHNLDQAEAREGLVLFAVTATFFFVAVQLFGESGNHQGRRFGLIVLLFSGILGLFAILQFASGTPLMYWTFDTSGQFFGPYSNADHYAGLMEMLLPVAVCYIASRKQQLSLGVLLLMASAAMVAVVSLLLTGSRGGLLALSTEIAIAGFLFRRKAQGANKLSLGAALAGALLTILLLFSWIDPGAVAQRFGVVVASGGQSWTSITDFRKDVALDTIRMLRDHPILGVGLGNFGIAYPPYQSFPSDLTIEYAHNDYVQASAETGAVGALLIVAALILFFRLAFRGLARGQHSSHRWIQLGATLGCCGLLVHSFFDFNLHIPANAAWFAVLAGVAVGKR